MTTPLPFNEAVLSQAIDMDGDSDEELIVLSQASFSSTMGVQLFESEAFAGSAYCDAIPNSTGASGAMSARGSQRASEARLTLEASQLPRDVFGLFLVSMTDGFTPMSGTSLGNLCLDGTVGRFDGFGQVQQSNAAGFSALDIDPSALPSPAGPVAAAAGETWYFQLWYRDSVGGAPVSNFTNGLSVTFR